MKIEQDPEEHEMPEERMKNLFMELYSNWEKMMAESLDAMLRYPAFIANMARLFESSLNFKEQMDRSTHAALHAMNLPSAKDIAEIFDILGSLRKEVEELKGKVDLLLQKGSQEDMMGAIEDQERKKP